MRPSAGTPQTFQFREIQGSDAQEELGKLLARAFPVREGTSFYDDFPVWDERYRTKMYRVGVYQSGKLVSTASVRSAFLKAPAGPLPVALIGCVATDPKWQGHGLASEAVSRALWWAKEQYSSIAFLWGSEHSLYRRLGFELCGDQLRLPLKELVDFSDDLGAPIGIGWQPSLMTCLQARSEGLALLPSDEAWVSAHRNVKWWWLGDPKAPRAYAAVGRGIDLHGLVHEWGGERQALLRILNYLEKTYPGLELLGSPALFRRYDFDASKAANERLCMARILDPSRVLAKFQVPDRGLLPGLKDAELTQRILGPGPASDGLPLPLWIWGLDGA